MVRLRLAVDIGGTFSDYVFFNEASGELRADKTLSTPEDPSVGVSQGLSTMLPDLSQLSFFVHGTTVAINALIERKGAVVGLVTTRGFRDVYEIGRHNRERIYDLKYRKPEPLVRRMLRAEVSERIDHRGRVLIPLAVDEVRSIVELFRKHGVKSVAICLINSYVNPIHEQVLASKFRELAPEMTISVSHEIAREWREYERTSTTVINAYVAPVVDRYLSHLESYMNDGGYKHKVLIMQSSGGMMTAEAARVRPSYTIMSGPAGGVVGAAFIGELCGFKNVVSLDMGGTSTDVCLLEGGVPKVAPQARVERHPLLVPFMELHSIGAGGGSIAWIAGGTMHVGPESAGADPGPVCYGRGGTRPTVTDANVVAGRIEASNFLGGRMSLDIEGARKAIGELANTLDLTVEEAAEGILRIVEANMIGAIRVVSVEKGYDPRDFALVVFGGAGPLHGAAMAREMGISHVIVPVLPSTFSAFGMLMTDARLDQSHPYLRVAAEARVDELNDIFARMCSQAVEAMRADGFDESQLVFLRSLDIRYVGQEHTLNVALPEEMLDEGGMLRGLRDSFESLHRARYAFALEDVPLELVSARVVCVARIQRPSLRPLEQGGRNADTALMSKGSRVHLEGSWQVVPVYRRELLRAGNEVTGPAVVSEVSSATVIYSGQRASVDSYGNLIIETGV